MKHFSLLLLSATLCLLFDSCNQIKVINNPKVLATNTRTIEIGRIVLSDTATVFYLDAYNEPGLWVKITSETSLEGDVTGRIYKLMRSEGFEIDKEVVMPESGNVAFKLYFEPIDKKETAVSWMGGFEAEEDEMFVINGIQLNERKENGKIKCKITGTVIDRPQSSRLMLLPYNTVFDVFRWISVPIRDGKFDYTFYVDAEEAYELIFYEEPAYRGMWRPVPFFAEKGVIAFTLYPDEKGDENIISSRAPLNTIMKSFQEQLKNLFDFNAVYAEQTELIKSERFYSSEYRKWREDINNATTEQERSKLFKLYDELQKSGDMYSEEGKALNERRKQLQLESDAWTLDYIKNNPSLPAYYELFSTLRYAQQRIETDSEDIDISPYFAVYEDIYKKKFPSHPYTSKMEMLIMGNTIKEGGRYIDFTAPDASGKEFTLSELISGKVALINLWASWCGPCRYGSKKMIPVYEQYKDRGFTVVGIAREMNVSHMVSAVEKDGYPWLNLVEIEDHGKIWEKYGESNSSGTRILVDRTGTILAVNPTVEQVIAILEEKL